MNIGGRTKPYAVLGHPITHTLSPVMHNAAFQSLGIDAVYLAFDVSPSDLPTALSAMRDLAFGGLNLTVPLKEEVLKYLSQSDSNAERLGAVNTVEFLSDGTTKGYNTDGAGFVDGVKEAFGVNINGLSVLLLGSGGAGRAVAITCAIKGAKKVAIGNRNLGRAVRLAEEISRLAPSVAVEAVDVGGQALLRACEAAQLIVQATPIGLRKDDPSLLEPEAFHPGQMAYDLIYTAPETAFMKAATRGGAKSANGLGMLLHQGARAFTIWTGKEAPVEAMRRALVTEVYGPVA
jgi:shikimate dehydrogenase